MKLTSRLEPTGKSRLLPTRPNALPATPGSSRPFRPAKSRKYGAGRALHRKQITAASGSLQVLDDLPDFARQGLFARPATFDVQVRLSNGGMDRAADRTPDIRGFAIRVLGVEGDSALGGPARSQDFTLINQEQFAFPKGDEFVAFVAAAAGGGGSLLKFLFKRYGLFGGPARLLKLVSSVGKPFGGLPPSPCSARCRSPAGLLRCGCGWYQPGPTAWPRPAPRRIGAPTSARDWPSITCNGSCSCSPS